PCTADACDPASGCTNSPIEGVCEDGDPCTVQDICEAGVCTSGNTISCDDGNPCTHEDCILGSCVFEANDGPCDDLNECTAQDLCIDGICLGTAGVLCDDGNACTTDACDPDNGCHYEFNNQGCSDDDVCTQGDTCAGGECVSGPELICDDQNPCTTDACLTEVGCDHEALDDGIDCPGAGPHWCQVGQCVPMEYCGDGVQNQASEQCDDGNEIDDDLCSNTCTINAPIDVTFTTCGASGPTGPSEPACQSAYAGQFGMENLKVSQGIQLWSVPVSGTFRIEAIGAQGGGGGGQGAHVQGEFTLQQGDVLKVLVGQMGGTAPAQVGNGGGGGSFVATDSDQALIIAGGGGGTGHNTHGAGYGDIDGRTGG
ncbi:MAG: hypothetical protein VX938_05780, partial [Myxococcota bacterium]|nr:hypothetical protein [Myxococcota bacterium]